MNSSKLVLGMLWTAPLTLLVFLVYVLPCWLLGWYQYDKWDEIAWSWTWTGKGPKVMKDYWAKWGGHAMGNLVITREPAHDLRWKKLRHHELHHVKQCMRLGLFQPVLYLLSLVTGKLLWHMDGYRDNLFEVDARRAADAWVLEQATKTSSDVN